MSSAKLVLADGREIKLSADDVRRCVQAIAGKSHERLTAAEKSELKRLALEGYAIRDMADLLGRPYQIVYNYIRRRMPDASMQSYPLELKKHIAYEHLVEKKPARLIAHKYGMHINSVYNWVNLYQDEVLQWSK